MATKLVAESRINPAVFGSLIDFKEGFIGWYDNCNINSWVLFTKYYINLAMSFGAHDSVDKVENLLTPGAADHLAKAMNLKAL